MPIFPERRRGNESPKKGFCFSITNPGKMFDVAFKAGVDLAEADPGLGFEPRMSGSEPEVMPLHYPGV